jgi:vacuolar protein sorting-associated protein 13A/C
MYDKMLLKLQAAQVSLRPDSINVSNAIVQFVLGNDLQACRDALTSEKSDTLHLLERININLLVQNTIVPAAVNLARFKISGKLPSLQVNISDAKYKSLMRLIDVAIPNFDEGGDQKPPQMHIDTAPLALPLSTPLFGPVGTEYNVDDHDEADSEAASTHRDDLFFEASDGSLEVDHVHPPSPVYSPVMQHPEIRQHIFELDFEVDTLRGAISKSSSDGSEKPLGEVIFQQFRLAFSLLKFNMNVDINLRYAAQPF